MFNIPYFLELNNEMSNHYSILLWPPILSSQRNCSDRFLWPCLQCAHSVWIKWACMNYGLCSHKTRGAIVHFRVSSIPASFPCLFCKSSPLLLNTLCNIKILVQNCKVINVYTYSLWNLFHNKLVFTKLQ